MSNSAPPDRPNYFREYGGTQRPWGPTMIALVAGALALKGYLLAAIQLGPLLSGPYVVWIDYRLPDRAEIAGREEILGGIDALLEAIGNLPDGEIGAVRAEDLKYLGLD